MGIGFCAECELMTLKAKNTPWLVGYVILLAAGFAFANGLHWKLSAQVRVTKEGMGLVDPLLAAGVHLGVLVLSHLLPSSLKHQIIFMRRRYPLPGSRIFTALDKDERISTSALEAKYGKLPSKPKEQHALWYRIYRQVEKDQVIRHSHGIWLLFREFSLTLLLALPASLYTYLKSGSCMGSYLLAGYVTLLLMLCLAGRNAANRFAYNVLAVGQVTQ